ncbi:hypothetical protein PFLUV_G00206540 [Perca fluviatilis]|uniref:Uncharacterized protein n=1 Tax=Perca fluviatilis TaxID=8168 RepID=A0A6A5EGH2_PERFL|nr:hypothetical protein PFLUV_G00206540 [Perca fluviatilis]
MCDWFLWSCDFRETTQSWYLKLRGQTERGQTERGPRETDREKTFSDLLHLHLFSNRETTQRLIRRTERGREDRRTQSSEVLDLHQLTEPF